MTDTTGKSYHWDGSIIGDSVLAPYDQTTKNIHVNLITGAEKSYIIPAYLGNLIVTETSPVSNAVLVSSGGAWVEDRLYINESDVTLSISPNASGFGRIDSVILEVDYVAHTVRSKILQGTPSATPVAPTLTQTQDVLWQARLANVWVDDSFATLADEDTYMVMEYLANTTEQDANQNYEPSNLVENSEFLAWSDLAVSTGFPEYFDDVGSGNSFTPATKPDQQKFGRAVNVQNAGALGGILWESRFPLIAGEYYVLKMLIKPITANVIIDVESPLPTDVATYIARPSGSWQEIKLHFIAGAATNETRVRLDGSAFPFEFELGQMMIFKGFHAGDFRHFSETIMFTENSNGGSDANWLGNTIAAGATDNSGLDFSDWVIPGIRLYHWRFDIENGGGGASVVRVRNGSGGGNTIQDIFYLDASEQESKRIPSNDTFGVENVAGGQTITVNTYLVGIDT